MREADEVNEESARAKQQRLIAENRESKQRTDLERSNAILAEEDGRRAADAAKTAKLRELRVAKEAAELEAASPKAKLKTAKGRRK